MEPTVTLTPPKFPQDVKAPFLDRIGKIHGDVAKLGGLLRELAHQSDVAATPPPDLDRPGLHEMADPDLEEIIRPSLGKRASRRLVRFLIVFSIGVGATLAWQWYGDSARATWPQPEPAPVPQAAPEQTAAAPQATAPELQQLKEDLAQVKQDLQQFKEMPPALASLRQSVDQLAGSQQQIAGTIAKLAAPKPASPPRPAPAVKPLTPPLAPKPFTPPQEVR